MKLAGLKRAFLSLVVMGFAVGAVAEEPSTKIGYVDMQKAIQSTSAGKKAKKNLEKAFNKKKKELKKKEEDIKKMSKDFEKKKLVLSEEVKQLKENKLRTSMIEYREQAAKSQLELQKKEQDMLMPIVEKLRSLINDLAKKEKFTLIIGKSEANVLFADKKIDLTDRLIQAYEKAK